MPRLAALVILTFASVVSAHTQEQATPHDKNAPPPPAVHPAAPEKKVPVAGHPVTLLKDVKSLYIAPMPDDLDQYLRAEVLKQLPGRIAVVLKPEEADAVMTGAGVWQKDKKTWLWAETATGAISVLSGDKLLWASEAGDRDLWWGVMARHGPRKVAARIVHNLKRALQNVR